MVDEMDSDHIMVRCEKVNVHGKVSRTIEKWHRDTVAARLSQKNSKTSYHELITGKYIRLFFDIDDYEVRVDLATVDTIVHDQFGFLPKRSVLVSDGGK